MYSPITHGHAITQVRTRDFAITEATYPAGYSIPRHGHESASLTFVLSGKVSEAVQGRSEALGPHELLLKPAAASHSNSFGERGARLLLVEILEPNGAVEPAIRRAFARSQRVTAARAVAPLVRIGSELDRNDRYSPLSIEGLLLELMAELGRAASCDVATEPAWLRRTRERLHAGLSQSPQLAELAAAEGVNAMHLSRQFRRRYGCSMCEYVRRLRLEQVMHALSATNESICSIALRTGFADQSHLTRELRRATGLTPRQYRLQTFQKV